MIEIILDLIDGEEQLRTFIEQNNLQQFLYYWMINCINLYRILTFHN